MDGRQGVLIRGKWMNRTRDWVSNIIDHICQGDNIWTRSEGVPLCWWLVVSWLLWEQSLRFITFNFSVATVNFVPIRWVYPSGKLRKVHVSNFLESKKANLFHWLSFPLEVHKHWCLSELIHLASRDDTTACVRSTFLENTFFAPYHGKLIAAKWVHWLP